MNNLSKFNCFIPFDIDEDSFEKARSTKQDDDSRYNNMIFSGVASDNSKDTEGETLDPLGYDLQYFLKSGLFNLDHLTTRATKHKSRYWIGEPISAEVKGSQLIVKGKLWKSSAEARAFWDKALEMKESGSDRRPGMSIEGKALERDKLNPKKISKALITNIALTFNPVNGNTFVDVAKGMQSQDFIQLERDPSITLNIPNIGRVTFNKSLQMKIEKSQNILAKLNEADNEILKAIESGRISSNFLKEWIEA